MTIASWALKSHPFFIEISRAIEERIGLDRNISFDALVVSVRRPLRPILLVLDGLHASGALHRLGWEPRGSSHLGTPGGEFGQRYRDLTADPGDLALLWTQRRLTRMSALDRASYVSSFIRKARGVALFLGDDDLVSPLVAAMWPSWRIKTIDIDSNVLRKVDEVAKHLGAHVETLHADLATAELDESPDLIVCDPFPTKDGGFERIFWSPASRWLKRGGLLISTSFPSHKPTAYSREIASVLARLDFSIVDQKIDGGAYEVYDFDLVPFERDVISRLRLDIGLHHTKSLFAAEKISDRPPSAAMFVDADAMAYWADYFSGHYLTVSAGEALQAQIEQTRRPASAAGQPRKLARKHSALDVAALIPGEYINRMSGASVHTPSTFDAKNLGSLRDEAGPYELDDLKKLAAGEYDANDLDAPLALVVRALESWSR